MLAAAQGPTGSSDRAARNGLRGEFPPAPQVCICSMQALEAQDKGGGLRESFATSCHPRCWAAAAGGSALSAGTLGMRVSS